MTTKARSAAGLKTRRKFLEAFRIGTLQIVVTILVITFLIPAIWMVSSALKSSTEIFVHPIVWIPESPRWGNFLKVFTLPSLPFLTFLVNTIKVVVFAVGGTVLSSAMVGYAFARLEWPGRNLSFRSPGRDHVDPRCDHPDPALHHVQEFRLDRHPAPFNRSLLVCWDTLIRFYHGPILALDTQRAR